MVTRAQSRCTRCGCRLPAVVVWAGPDTCGWCLERLSRARSRPTVGDVLVRAMALLHAESPARLGHRDRAKRWGGAPPGGEAPVDPNGARPDDRGWRTRAGRQAARGTSF